MIHPTEPPDRATGEALLPMGEPTTDPVQASRLKETFERFAENRAWFERHARQIGRDHPGKFVSVVGGELFVGDDAKELDARVRAAHPEAWNSAFRTHVRPHPVA